MNHPAVKFSNHVHNEFFTTLRARVNSYFDDKHISKYANPEMVSKTTVMLALYFVPYVLMVSGFFQGFWIMFMFWMIMSIGKSGIGMSIMHDANHGSYSKHPVVNGFLGYLLNFVGGSSVNWKIQHNILHHTYTNVEGMDEDINSGQLMRFSPNQKRLKVHRLQIVYAWFLYGLLTINWFLWKDIPQIFRYRKLGHIKGNTLTFTLMIAELFLSKIVYAFLFLWLPYYMLDLSFLQIFIGFFAMHFVTGLTLACIFNSAHVLTTSDYALPNDNGQMENNWAVHQLLNTSNFAPKSKLFSWFVGGLNFQIEHHLFPHICHVHYKNISKIVKQTTKEYGIPYNEYRTFREALSNHAKMLWHLGKGEDFSTFKQQIA